MGDIGLLDLFLEDLESENRSVRCEALRQLAETTLDNRLETRLRGLAQDPDPEIQFLSKLALQSHEDRKQAVKLVFPTYKSVADLREKVRELPFGEFRQICTRCPKEYLPDLMEAFRGELKVENKPERIISMIRAFRRHGGPQDQELLSGFLQGTSPALAIETLGVLEKHSPDFLREALPTVLQSNDLGLQGRALRSMLKLSPPAGVEFLKQQFASHDPVTRAYAVMHCLAVPFDLIREPLFDMLAAEEDDRILTRAAYVLFLNPEEKTVWWLMDVSMGARPAKGRWCQKVIEAVLESIKVSGIMAGSVAEFMQKVRDLVRQRQLDTRLRSMLHELDDPDPLRRYEGIVSLRVYENEPEVRERFRKMYLEESDEKVKNLLTGIFAQNPDRPKLQRTLIPGTFQKLKPPEQMDLLGQIKNVEDFSCVRDSLQALARLRLDPYVQAEVVRLLGMFGDEKGELSPLSVALKSVDGVVVARAIEGLSRVGPRNLLKELPRLIRSPIASVRTAALRAFFQEDKIQTLSVLREMLISNSSQAKEQGLVCLAQINYSSSRELLLKFMQEEGNLALVKKAGVILRLNPDPDAIRFLHQQWKRASGPKKVALEEILKESIELAVTVEIVPGPPEAYLKSLES